MKKEIFIHFAFFVSLFIFISLVKGFLLLSYWPLWAGGMVGTLLPDLDHIIYVYFLKPHELTSQRASYMVGKGQITRTFQLLAETRSERTKLIFHTATFQIIFLVLAFLVLTSSGSIFGRGLVLAFSLHLLVDQIVDITDTGNLDSWFQNLPFVVGKDRQKIYWIVLLALSLLFAFFL